jgi:hypothetical protein
MNDETCAGLVPGGVCDDGGSCAWTGVGDPALTMAVPVRQYRNEYIVHTPEGYRSNTLTLATSTGFAPFIDGVRVTAPPISATAEPLGSDFEIYRVSVEPGSHLLQSSAGFGVVAYGYDCDVAYAYPGGLNIEAAQ